MAYQSNLRNKLKCPTLSPDHKPGLQSPSSPGSALVTQQHSMGNTKVPLLYTLNMTLIFPPVESFLSVIDYLQRVLTYWTRMWQGYTLTDSHNTVYILSGYPRWKVCKCSKLRCWWWGWQESPKTLSELILGNVNYLSTKFFVKHQPNLIMVV